MALSQRPDSGWARGVSLAFAALIALAAAPVRVEAADAAGSPRPSVNTSDIVVRSGRYVTTGGTLDFGPGSRVMPRRQADRPAAADPFWLNDLVERLLAGVAEADRPARRLPKRPTAAAKTTTPAAKSAHLLPVPPPVVPGAMPKAAPTIAAPVPGGVPGVVTGAIDRTPATPTPSAAASDINRDDLDAAVIGDAEISQAREDLVKLELARRTYDETRLSGATAFDTRHDWRILERGRDAWTATELAAAVAAGFEANTYISETSKTIVVAIAGTQDLRRDFIEADIWRALIQAEAPQHFFLAKSYIRSVMARYQAAGFHTECVGHSLGGGACAYAGSELGIRAVVVNPISAGRLSDLARNYVTNYVVDGDIAAAIYQLRGNELSGDVQKIRHDRDAVRDALKRRYGFLAGPIRVVRDLRNAVKVHQIERALDIIAAYAGTSRVK